MSTPPVEDTSGLVHFTDGAPVYAGRHRHEGGYPAHTHSFVEIAVVVAGEGTHDCVTGRQRLAVGDTMLLRSGVWHAYEDCAGLELFNCCFSTELLQHELAWTREDALLGHLLWTGPYSMDRRGVLGGRLDQSALAECLPHLEALHGLRFRTAGHHRADVIARLLLFLSHLARAVTPGLAEERGTGPTHPSVVAGMRMLEERLAHAWTLPDLAEQLHLAPSYLVRLFKATVGLPPMAYLAQQRAETAARLLLHTDHAISQIGHEVGWSDANYFARRFKSHFGLSASDYRRRFAHSTAVLQPRPSGVDLPPRTA
ncbi:AraC family transcriptional regulator [Streptomyces mirabilis]|uniref:AraC family transcriptional regulator n=1 Tax=Streptomyces mirabilis TaxID=68239 RepID=UPI0033B0C388